MDKLDKARDVDANRCIIPSKLKTFVSGAVNRNLEEAHEGGKSLRDRMFTVTEGQINRRFKVLPDDFNPGDIIKYLENCDVKVVPKPTVSAREGDGIAFAIKAIKPEKRKEMVQVQAAMSAGERAEHILEDLVGLIEGCTPEGGEADSDTTRVCVLKSLPELKVEGCGVKTVLFSDGSCGPCADAKDILTAGGIPFEVVDTRSERGVVLQKKVEGEHVPQLLLLDCNDDFVAELEIPGRE